MKLEAEVLAVLNIVLVEPEIPQNCGNIARTCAATGCRLHLIRPLGFDISEKAVRRAGLDYWNLVEVLDYENLQDFFSKNQVREMWKDSSGGILLRRDTVLLRTGDGQTRTAFGRHIPGETRPLHRKA